MKVLNLQCAHQHSFEGWFGSENDFQEQLARGLIECPLCSDRMIQKLPSAPRLNLGGHQTGSDTAGDVSQKASLPSSALSVTQDKEMSPESSVPHSHVAEQAFLLKALRQVMAQTEDVGQRFADEARRMHYGDAKARNIRGQTSIREAVELLEEGIEIMPLPLPPALKETLQ